MHMLVEYVCMNMNNVIDDYANIKTQYTLEKISSNEQSKQQQHMRLLFFYGWHSNAYFRCA
jgi:hypothetical protein